MSKPTVGSLFSGVGGFDLGLERAGFEVRWQVEIDPFCNQVLAKHWPEVPRYGDVRDIGLRLAGRRVDDAVGDRDSAAHGDGAYPRNLDLICGGFPCQDLSVAGKRAGLAGDRSGLWFEFHRILSELRPTFVLIENVPGLLSSDRGRDFGIVLGGLAELWPAVGWAVLDSQHFGVPQRRRRVYIVGGPTRASVQQVLSLCEGGDWHPQKGREAGEDVAASLSRGSSAASNEPGRRREDDVNLVIVPALTASGRGTERTGESRGQDPLVVAGTVTPRSGAHTGNSNPIPDNYVIAHTLSADGFDASEDGTGRGTPLVASTLTGGEGKRGFRGDDGTDTHVVAVRTANTGANGHGIADDVAHTLDGANGQAIAGASVRRLTPVECERLQGFPDGWLDIPGAADGPKYRALGNAVSVPVVEYLGLRLLEVLA